MSATEMTRRGFAAMAAGAGTLLEGAADGIDATLVRRHDEAVERFLKIQVTGTAHAECGGYPDEFGLYHPSGGAGLLDYYMSAFAAKESKFHRSNLLAQRMKLAAEFLERKQHEDGTIDLLITNFHSTPDTGFTVHNAAGAAWLAREYKEPELFNRMVPFLKKAGNALATGGVHTPNHRWVVCEALAQLNELFPDPRYTRRIDQWLAEGIDIDEDGQFDERSTTVYNPVSDKALVVMAAKLGRKDLLGPVRQNLTAMLYLLHPGGDVVTEISTRQDQYDRAGMDRYWFPLRMMALKDGDGKFAEVVGRIEARAASLSAYLRYPELSKPLPASAPLPEDFEKMMPALHIARIRRGARSASILYNGNSRFFTLRNGDCVIDAVRFASAFFGKGQFRPESMVKSGSAYRLKQSMDGPYYQPLDPPRKLGPRDYGASRAQRRQSEVQKMRYSADIVETKNGFTMEIAAEGTDRVPLAVEIGIREGVKTEGVAAVPKMDGAFLLKEGFAVCRAGNDGIRFGPGFSEHVYTQVRGAEAKLRGPSVYLCGFTPLRKTIRFEYL